MCAAASTGIGTRKIALVIGNNKYKLSPLNNCVNDANDFSEELRNMGFAVTTKTDVKYEDMDNAVDNFVDSVCADDFVLFFFSGHGMQHENQNYLIPCDDDRIKGLSDLKHRAVHAQRILELASEKSPFVIVYFLDCCRTYSLPNMARTKSLAPMSNGMAPMSAKAGMLIAFACAPGTIAIDHSPNQRNGIFTYHLLKHIIQPDEITMLLRDVTKAVFNDTARKQMPHITSALMERDIYLTKNGKMSYSLELSLVRNSKL